MFAEQPVAIIDIGSNSVRLVVYSGATRIPSVIFNEKVLAGLGQAVGETGAIARRGRGARARRAGALPACSSKQMKVVRTRTVATAAVREASNGAAFLAKVRKLGLEPRILSGEEEGQKGGAGRALGHSRRGRDRRRSRRRQPRAGRSRRRRGPAQRLAAARRASPRRACRRRAASPKRVAKAVAAAGFDDACEGRPFYMVGGSWRALARLDMALARPSAADHPPVLHGDRRVRPRCARR